MQDTTDTTYTRDDFIANGGLHDYRMYDGETLLTTHQTRALTANRQLYIKCFLDIILIDGPFPNTLLDAYGKDRIESRMYHLVHLKYINSFPNIDRMQSSATLTTFWYITGKIGDLGHYTDVDNDIDSLRYKYKNYVAKLLATQQRNSERLLNPHLFQDTFERGKIPDDTFERGEIPDDTFKRGEIPDDTFKRGKIPSTFISDVRAAVTQNTTPVALKTICKLLRNLPTNLSSVTQINQARTLLLDRHNLNKKQRKDLEMAIHKAVNKRPIMDTFNSDNSKRQTDLKPYYNPRLDGKKGGATGVNHLWKFVFVAIVVASSFAQSM